MEILRFSNHFSQINEEGNKSCSHSHLTSVGFIKFPQVRSDSNWKIIVRLLATFKLHHPPEEYLFDDRLRRTDLACPVFRYVSRSGLLAIFRMKLFNLYRRIEQVFL